MKATLLLLAAVSGVSAQLYGGSVVQSGVAPAVQKLQSITGIQGAQRTKVRLGPWTMPGINERNLQSMIMGTAGMVDKFASVPKPCTECTILSMNADLEYANGQSVEGASTFPEDPANINILGERATPDKGAWLHHTGKFQSFACAPYSYHRLVLSARGSTRRDPGCGTAGSEAFFSSGNERNRHDYANLNGTVDTGYHLHASDSLMIMTELMNMLVKEQTVYLSLYFDYIPYQPKFKKTRVVWLQLHQCGKADVTSGNLGAMDRPVKAQFTETTAPWTSTLNGEIIAVSGHLHDGGTHLEVFQNNQVICDAVAKYSMDMPMDTQGGPSTQPMESISSINVCNNPGRTVKAGDSFHISAHYDFNKHAG